MLYILFGEDDFSLREALEELKASLGDREWLVANTTVFEGKKLTLEQLMTACDTSPFLAEKRLVIVEGLLSRFERTIKGRRPKRPPLPPEVAYWQPLKDYITKMPASTALVLIDGKLGRDNSLLGALAPVATVRQFPALRGAKLYQWIRLRIEKSDASIAAPAVRLLADLIGANLWVMSSEIEKLCLFAQGRRIEERDVRLLVSQARESSIFALVDAIIQRNSPLAVRTLHQLMNQGAAAPYILFMITRQFRMLLQAKELAAQRLPAGKLANRLGLVSEYALEKTMSQARGYSMPHLEEAYRQLLDTDVAIKTGKHRDELALDLLVVELCRGRRA